MKSRPLVRMVPLGTNNLEIEFNDVCEYVFVVTHLPSFEKKGCSYYKKGLTEVLRCFCHKFRPTRISEKAFESSKCEKIKGDLLKDDLYKKWYNERENFKPLFQEHIIPLGSLIDRCRKCDSSKDVVEVLSELEAIIILKEEDDMLTNNGYKSKGRETIHEAQKAYEKCGIILREI